MKVKMNENRCCAFVLTLFFRFLFCDDSAEVSLLNSEPEKTQNNVSDISLDNWTKHDDWKSDKVWQNMLAVAVQVHCVHCSYQTKYR